MFTGIVQAIGILNTIERGAVDMRLGLSTDALDLSDVRAGDSIAVNGVCLTALDVGASGFFSDVSLETLTRTTLGRLVPGSRVNLEKSLLPTTRLGGHLVAGHVDAVGHITQVEAAGRSQAVRIESPPELARYLVPKGSVCVDGVSLTVNEVAGAVFSVNLIPHTLASTICDEYGVGRAVNIEVDIIARYLEGLLQERAAPRARVDRAFLSAHGFITDA